MSSKLRYTVYIYFFKSRMEMYIILFLHQVASIIVSESNRWHLNLNLNRIVRSQVIPTPTHTPLCVRLESQTLVPISIAYTHLFVARCAQRMHATSAQKDRSRNHWWIYNDIVAQHNTFSHVHTGIAPTLNINRCQHWNIPHKCHYHNVSLTKSTILDFFR